MRLEGRLKRLEEATAPRTVRLPVVVTLRSLPGGPRPFERGRLQDWVRDTLRDPLEGNDSAAVRIALAYDAAMDRALEAWDWRSDPYGWRVDFFGDAERAAQGVDDAILAEQTREVAERRSREGVCPAGPAATAGRSAMPDRLAGDRHRRRGSAGGEIP